VSVVVPGLSGCAQGQQRLPLGRELAHDVGAGIDDPDVPLPIELDLVGAAEPALAPRLEQLTLAVEDLHRHVAPVERPDPAPAVDGDARDLAPGVSERPAWPHGIDLVADGQVVAWILRQPEGRRGLRLAGRRRGPEGPGDHQERQHGFPMHTRNVKAWAPRAPRFAGRFWGMAMIGEKLGHCFHDSFTFPSRPGSPSP
jgi:hypothetical protein